MRQMILEKIVNKLIIFACAIISPIEYDLLAVAILVLADLVTGILASLRADEKFESKRLKFTIVKIFLYELVVVMAQMLQDHIIHGNFPIVSVVLTTICFVEFTSLVENLSKYTGNNVGKLISEKIKSMLNASTQEKK